MRLNMKKIILIIVFILFASSTYAEIKIIEKIGAGELKKTIPKNDSAFTLTRVCVDGLEFVVTGVGHHTSIVQAYDKSGPKTCK